MKRKGFTLTELLAVIGVIVLLIGILLPSLSSARRQAGASRVRTDFQAIVAALNQYQHELRNFPPVPAGGDGAVVLATALTQKQAVRPNGPAIHGPYLDADRFGRGSAGELLDNAMDQPIRYLPLPDGLSFTLRAVGWDGVYDTEDDITYP